MTYDPKAWATSPTRTTPLNGTALRALEARVASFAAAEAMSPGTGGYEHFRVKQQGVGAMAVDVGLAGTAMQAWVRSAGGGTYRYEYNGTQLSLVIGTADGSNPRVDRVVMTAPSSVDSIVPQVLVLPGTPTSGATTDNLTGAQSVPAGYLLLADIVVGQGVSTIVTANIRDRRRNGGQMGTSGIVVPIVARDEVTFVPSPALPTLSQTLTPTTHDNMQGAYKATLSRRILGATRIRFRFAQGATPATSNFMVGVADASGRLIIASASTAFSGIASALVEGAATIAATDFEAGDYFPWMGVAALTASSAISFFGVQGSISITAPGPSQRGAKYHSATGGVTAPTTFLAYTDVAAAVAAAAMLPMPIMSLSVG